MWLLLLLLQSTRSSRHVPLTLALKAYVTRCLSPDLSGIMRHWGLPVPIVSIQKGEMFRVFQIEIYNIGWTWLLIIWLLVTENMCSSTTSLNTLLVPLSWAQVQTFLFNRGPHKVWNFPVFLSAFVWVSKSGYVPCVCRFRMWHNNGPKNWHHNGIALLTMVLDWMLAVWCWQFLIQKCSYNMIFAHVFSVL